MTIFREKGISCNGKTFAFPAFKLFINVYNQYSAFFAWLLEFCKPGIVTHMHTSVSWEKEVSVIIVPKILCWLLMELHLFADGYEFTNVGFADVIMFMTMCVIEISGYYACTSRLYEKIILFKRYITFSK